MPSSSASSAEDRRHSACRLCGSKGWSDCKGGGGEQKGGEDKKRRSEEDNTWQTSEKAEKARKAAEEKARKADNNKQAAEYTNAADETANDHPMELDDTIEITQTIWSHGNPPCELNRRLGGGGGARRAGRRCRCSRGIRGLPNLDLPVELQFLRDVDDDAQIQEDNGVRGQGA